MQLSELPKTRVEAKLFGVSRYYTGEPCKYGHNAARFSINTSCQECSRIRAGERYKKNPSAHIKKTRQWALANKEKRKEISRNYASRNRDKQKAWDKANKEKVLEIKKRWKAKNKEATNANTRNRRAKLRGAEGKHTKLDILKMYDAQCGKCLNCLVSLESGYHVDHKVPVSRGGSNAPSNLQLLCSKCNCQKSNKDYARWCHENGRLL